MNISNNLVYGNCQNLEPKFKGIKKPYIPKISHKVVQKDGLNTTFAVLTGLFLGGLTLLGTISSGMLEEGKEKVIELISNKKEQDRINKLPEGNLKKTEQIIFDIKHHN